MLHEASRKSGEVTLSVHEHFINYLPINTISTCIFTSVGKDRRIIRVELSAAIVLRCSTRRKQAISCVSGMHWPRSYA
jgi:hypothetical protein